MWYMVYKVMKRYMDINVIPPKEVERDNLSELVKLMKEEREKRKSKERDEDLVEYAKMHLKKQGTGGIIMKSGMEEDRIRVNTGGELVQFNMSERDKAVLSEFYRRDI